MCIFKTLGFYWDRSSVPYNIPENTIERVLFRYHKMLADFVWSAGTLERNPFTYTEVKTLLDGVTVGGRRISDQEQILNIAAGSKRLFQLVKQANFVINKCTFCELHALITRNEAPDSGAFRGEGEEKCLTPYVQISRDNQYYPRPTVAGAFALNALFNAGIQIINERILSPFERAVTFFLFGALQKFFFKGNTRTAFLMMNGILMSHGIDAISIPADRAQEFNENMVRFYQSKDANSMIAFLIDCHRLTHQ